MKAVGPSLYTRLAVRLGLVLGVSGLILLAAVVFFTRYAANDTYDRILTGSALQIAENTWYENGRVNVDVPISTFAMLTASDQVFYAVMDPDGRIVAGDPELKPTIPFDKLADGPFVMPGLYSDLPVSIAVVGRRMPVAGANPWAVVLLAQTNNARQSVAKSLGINTSLLILAMGILTVVAALFTLHQALAPLKLIGSTMESRAMHDLSPLTQVVPAEIHSLVASINEFMRRLAIHRSMMRGVIGDAAHQLRTPVAALLSQMELLSGSPNTPSRERHLARLQELTSSLGELVNQLINHAMVQFRAESIPFASIDLVELARAVMAERLSDLAHAGLDIGLQAPDGAMAVQGDALALREAIKNIIDNALLYGAKTLLHMDIRQTEAHITLSVEDDGPGIPEAQWSQVRKPFSTRSGNRQGASLGLSIVEEVMRAHGGELNFGWRAPHHFVVSMRFPSGNGA